MKTPEPSPQPLSRRLGPIAVLALALGMQFGCGREFYRQWANQDSSEAIFEKSRDPRFRLDMFSIEPPPLSRHADPYDQDVPPAPPDDRATEAMAPAPQWPDHRLLVPVEGTGYLDMLESWNQQRPNSDQPAAAPTAPQPRTLPPPTAPLPGSASPFATPPNSGPNPPGTSPSSVPGPQPGNPTGPGANPPQTRLPKADLGVRLAASQATGIPLPIPAGEPSNLSRQPAVDLDTPAVGMDPNPINSDLSAPFTPRTDLSPDQYRASEAMGAAMAILASPGVKLNEAAAAGYPAGSKPYKITLEQAFTLSLINSRFYQFQLEQIYLAALQVTLQRFAFTPQFFAGLTPITPPLSVTPAVAGAPGVGFSPVPINQFTYRTRETGSPTSALNMGTVAGVGKVFNSGAKLVAGFANQIVFNFLGKNSAQPTVQSFLPVSLVQPFLRGGGRAVTLEPLTQAERSLVYQVRTFAQFRQDFLVTVLVGGQVANFGSLLNSLGFPAGISGNIDPVIGFINVLQDLQEIENDLKNIAAFEQLYTVYRELIQGESSGLSQLQLDQVDSNLQSARSALVTDKLTYRNDLDQFKIQLGMPPDVPLVLDRGLTRPFGKTFDDIDAWQRNPRRDMTDLPKIAAQLPKLEDVNIDGHSVLGVFGYHQQTADKKKGDVSEYVNQEDSLEELMLAAERVALERRLDVMNSRAGLYDAWRQIRVTANALRGVFNVTLTNQFLTPPTTTNPFAFLEQAKQFSLVINAELPLVRLAERKNFRTALISYQRARRQLMEVEDFTKYQVRSDIRGMQTQYLTYEIARRNLVLTIRQKDQAFEQIIAPPAGAASATQATQAAVQTTNLINFQGQLLARENQLAMNWQAFQLSRLTLYRDLGIMPYDEWEAFHELFPTEYVNRDVAAAVARPASGPEAAPAEVISAKFGVLLAAAALAAAGAAFNVPVLNKSIKKLFAATEVEIIHFPVKPAHLPVTVVERGLLESSENEDVFCQVEGSTTIIMILPEGSRVTNGQLVCELDSSALQDNLKNQKIATLGAQAAFENAKLTREVAEIGVVEYVEGIYKQESETVEGEIALADAEQKRAADRIEWSDRMFQKGYLSKAQNIADQVSLKQKIFALEQAQTKKQVLQKYTKDKTIKELQSEVEKSKSDELAKQQTWELEKDKEAKLEKQIKNCKLFAPGDGIVVYANDPSRFGSTAVQIEEGAAVRERQKIFSLPNINRMRVNAKVHESMVDRIKPHLPARIRVDAFSRREDGGEEILTGNVESINPLPDTNSSFSSDIKVYTTRVTIDRGLPGLRPGMSAEVEILVTELDNVLCVPVQAIIEYGGKDHVAVKSPSGAYERRVVSLGISNDKLIEVTKGLKTGDLVALNPVALMSEEEKRDLLGSSSKGSEKKDWGDAAKKTANSLVGKDAFVAKTGPDGKGAEGAGKGKGQGKGKGGQGKGGGGFPKMDPAVREQLKNAGSPEEKRKILEGAGMSPELIERMLNRGSGGGGGGPRGGGGFGGPPGGGGQ